MVQLVEAIAKSLVDDPASVVVTSEETKQAITISLRVAPDDMGRSFSKSLRHRRRGAFCDICDITAQTGRQI